MTPNRIRAARLIAAGVDLLQIALVPTFFPAAVSGANNVIDVMAAVALVALTGWHRVYLPAFMIELVPMADLAPTWSTAVYIVTRGMDEDAIETEAVVESDEKASRGALPPPDQSSRPSSGS